MATIWKLLTDRGVTARVVFDGAIRTLLEDCNTVVEPAPGLDDVRGQIAVAMNKSPLPLLSLQLTPPLPQCDYHLVFEGGNPASGFRLFLALDTFAGAAVPGAKAVLEFIGGLPGHVLKAATHHRDQADGREWLEAVQPDTPATLEGLRLSLLIAGKAGEAASMKLSPTDGGAEGMVVLKLVPPTVLIGSSGFGLQLPDNGPDGQPLGIVIDDSEDAVPPGTTRIDGQAVDTPADDPAWRGIAIRHVRFFLPEKVPFFGGHALDAHLQIGFEPPGIDLAIVSKVPPTETRPGLDVRVEFRDPTARGLTGFAPTLVEVAMTLKLDGREEDVGGKGLVLVAGTPVVARARFSRLPEEGTTKLSLALESQGDNGIVAVHAPEGGTAARLLIAAAALATAIVADDPPAGADASGVVLHALLLAALGASAFLKDKGKVVVHGVELESTGHGLPVGDEVKLLIDYSVDVLIVPLDVGALSVALREEQPMRVRNRRVGLSFLPNESGLNMLKLDFSRADMEIEDPGSWQVHGPASLFDILGTRSGRGSMWLEVDLRFKLNLGPVRISGATIRATLDTATGDISASLQGLDASIDVPAVFHGRGKLQLLEGGGFAADLAVNVVPLNLAAAATVLYKKVAGGWWLFLRLAVDLPGPLPIANTGLGIYGLAGSFGINARPTSPPPGHPDPIGWQLAWDASDPLTAFTFAADQLTIGVEAVLGTVADMGYGFSAKGGLFLTVPDVAVRAALWGKLMSPRLMVTERPPANEVGLSFKGIAVIDPDDGVTVGLKGELNVPVLMKAVVPLGARFPVAKPPVANPSDWYLYLGADGYPNQGRGMGPMRVTVLPDLYPQHADAYLMLRGDGIERWPRGAPDARNYPGFIIAFGFSVEMSFGPRPIAWAEVHGGADILIATNPLTLAGFGRIGGSLNLGPFSIGVDAQLAFMVPESGPSWVNARVCGRIDLFFTEIEGCAEISVGSKPTRRLPPPGVHPLDAVEGEAIVGDLAYLIDGSYERLHRLPRGAADAPMVWPDTLIHLAFGVTPKVDAHCSGGQFDDKALAVQAAQPVGNDMLRYEWTLKALELFDVTGDEAGAGVKVVPADAFSAAWQKGKDGALGVRPQAGELVLLTYDGALWLQRLADGGASLPKSPLDDAGTLCQADVSAKIGWAVGAGAKAAPPGMRMPADPIDPDPCVSRFTAVVTTTTTLLPDVPLGVDTAGALPAPLWFTPLRVVAAQPPLALERNFDGCLQLGHVSAPSQDEPVVHRLLRPQNVAEIVPSSPIASPRLWIAGDELLLGRAGIVPGVQVSSAGGDWFASQPLRLADGRTAVRFEPRFGGMVTSVEVRWRLNAQLAVIGLGGITQAAIDAAAARNKFLQDQAQKLADAAAKQPPQNNDTQGPAVRCVLAAGCTYRLDVDLQWKGWLYEQDEAGNLQEVPQPPPDPQDPPPGTVYQPKVGPAQPTKRSFFFKTTPGTEPAPAGHRPDPVPQYGKAERLFYLIRRQDVFEPEMLQRHLLGYTPAQSETVRFADDPVKAHFGADHVTGLANAYGFNLKLALRRVDVPDDPGAAVNLGALISVESTWVALEAPGLLTQAGQLQHAQALASPCPLPKPGATLKAPPLPLATRAWHEVYVQVTRKENGVDVEAGRLPGVTFRTSRWRSPRDMLDGLGFPAMGGTRVRGDIALTELPALAPAVVEGEDAAYEDALATLGLEGWPAADEPRISQLWVQGEVDGAPGWLCAGVLIESPEPVHRPGRVTIASLAAVMRRDGAPAAAFDMRRRDRSGSRLLYLTSTPFVPRRWAFLGMRPQRDPMLVLTLDDAAGGGQPAGVMSLNLQPSFAAEA